jgi:hypothetical protein
LKPVERKGKWGYADPAGKMVIKPQFDMAYSFSEGLAPVHKGSGFGYVNQSGKLVTSPRFQGVGFFSEGLAEVKTGGKWGFIDRTGKMVIAPQFDSTKPFSEGLAVVGKDGVKKGWVIDKTGKMVIPGIDYPYSGRLLFKEGLAPLSIGFGYGYMDRTGKMVIAPSIRRLTPLLRDCPRFVWRISGVLSIPRAIWWSRFSSPMWGVFPKAWHKSNTMVPGIN